MEHRALGGHYMEVFSPLCNFDDAVGLKFRLPILKKWGQCFIFCITR